MWMHKQPTAEAAAACVVVVQRRMLKRRAGIVPHTPRRVVRKEERVFFNNRNGMASPHPKSCIIITRGNKRTGDEAKVSRRVGGFQRVTERGRREYGGSAGMSGGASRCINGEEISSMITNTEPWRHLPLRRGCNGSEAPRHWVGTSSLPGL